MSAINTSSEAAVVAADPSRPFTPRPVIAEILRTSYCAPGTVLLIEKIEANISVSKRYRTVRLLLGDGELCIQALLRSELHRCVDGDQFFEGCYVRLNRFDVHSVQLRLDQQGDDDEGSESPAEMVFLVVQDMATVGWNTAYMEIAGTAGQQLPIDMHNPPGPQGRRLPEAVAVRADAAPTALSNTGETLVAPPKEELENAVEAADEDDDEFEVMDISEQRAGDRRREAELLQQRASHLTGNSHHHHHHSWTPGDDLSKPLRLTPLRSIPNLPYKQNWAVNILAVVASLSEVEPALLPTYVGKQRTARLADPSTSKQVLLTIFLDPDEFAPEVGSVVLLLGVKNHRFDGGSLKKYGNEKPRDGARWWFENPTDISWCDVGGLRDWWKGQSH
ncbi:hypothetical protein VPNG_06179 [Cytospora leucostoma]|uniref:Uncharacterized protein n=1 Tax=Cytospora leucostoma TaxID=1230097 RepID=A0A423WYL8_9PEZI|nr:hypothetical protein VPNG_06179 [Cytospora leucostoma]